MSCAGKGFGKKYNENSNVYLNAQFTSLFSNTFNDLNAINRKKCRGYNGFYPNFTPILANLSTTTSMATTYVLVRITGSNFLPNGTTFVKFGSLGFLPVIYYSSFDLGFVVPSNAVAGNYEVQVVNLYTNNFSPQVNPSNPANLNYSLNSITYSIT